MIEADISQVCQLVENRITGNDRLILAIAGPPASGKSTLAEALVQTLNEKVAGPPHRATLLPMDGYHLDNRILETRGLRRRKGAPETFDADGFCSAVRGLRERARITYHPRFDRPLDLAVANAIEIRPETPIVVVEGNYLLLEQAPWVSLREIWDLSVFVCPTIEQISERLRQRWINHGFDQDMAEQKVAGNDLPNADLIISKSYEADLVLTQN